MSLDKAKCYHFHTAQHWQSGLLDQITISEQELRTPVQMQSTPLPGTGAIDETPALAIDPCGDIYWVREESFDLIRALNDGTVIVGNLGIDEKVYTPVRLVVGISRMWILVQSKSDKAQTIVFSYYTHNLQRLAKIDNYREILDITTDGTDGVWLLLGVDQSNGKLLHINQAGVVRLEEIKLPRPVKSARVCMDKCAGELLVLDINPQANPCVKARQKDPCIKDLSWCIWRVDICDDPPVSTFFSLPKQDSFCNHDIPVFIPNMIAVDHNGHIQLLEGKSGMYWSLSNSGEVLSQSPSNSPSHELPIRSLAVEQKIYTSSRFGIGKLNPTEATSPTALDSAPTFITPALVSPEDVQDGWMRADLAVDFTAGTAIEISVAATKDQKFVNEMQLITNNKSLSKTTRLHRANTRLPWLKDKTQIYQGGDWPTGSSLRFPLHEIDSTHLWLRLRVYTTEGALTPCIKSLRVYYPNISYARYLPAVYQEDDNSAKLLRRLLVIFESIFGDMDEQLDDLPNRINPKTAPDNWLPFLLRWLGLPAPTELDSDEQRQLLDKAPWLLRNRGTTVALEGLLKVLIGDGNKFSVEDNSEGPSPWVLSNDRSDTNKPRLGRDTLVMVQSQSGFRLGCRSTLGKQRLGYTPLDPMQLFARYSGKINIRVSVPSKEHKRLKPLLIRYLSYFIPAHCRYNLYFVAQSKLRTLPLLDSEFHLHSDSPPRLAEDARIGQMRLVGNKSKGIILGQATLSDGGPLLT